MVKLENEQRPIEQIKVGDMVYAYDFKLQKTILKPVIEISNNFCTKYVELYLANDVIKVTGSHQFWLVDANQWMAASELKTNMSLMNHKGQKMKIEKICIKEQEAKTYNFEVADVHNYFVGNNNILTHNGKSLSKSSFNSEELIEVRFYELDNASKEARYVGQTTKPTVGARYDQHVYEVNPYQADGVTPKKYNAKKKVWMDKIRGIYELEINGKIGPFKMTRFEAAVTEMYEMNKLGGKKGAETLNRMKNLENGQNPITQRKFEYFKKHKSFNPCRFYV
ncbi:MAG: hypothetical protein H6607_10670 [Flavobacteriales bacterium]|nr:hypothetical protein [Flavobacteriales bacterium]